MWPLLAACAAPVEVAEPPASVVAMWLGFVDPGSVVLSPVVVTSPRSVGGTSFWVQDPGGGRATGLRVDVVGFQAGIPPAVGTQVGLTGSWSLGPDGAPFLTIDDDLDVSVGGVAQVVAVPWTGDPREVGSPVAVGAVAVTSGVDPLGEADLDNGLRLRGTFGGVAGGWDEQASAAGILVAEGQLAPRGPEDWVVERPFRAAEPVAVADLADVPEGRPVRLEGVVQSAPWSDDGRWTAVQRDGAGVWIDAEGWGVGGEEGDLASWEGEVRRGSDGLRLRTWLEPEILGTAGIAEVEGLAEGQRTTFAFGGLGEPDAYGARSTDAGFAVDDRFTSLDDLPDPAVATGIGRVGPDGALQLAPFAWD